MPTEVKQRKKSQKQSDGVSETSPTNGKDEAFKEKTEARNNAGADKTSSSVDSRSVMCFFLLVACGALGWYVSKLVEYKLY